MRIRCKTNLDLRGELWPTELPALPRVGDRIQSRKQHAEGFRLELEVVAVTFVYIYAPETTIEQGYIPEIELHMTSWQRCLYPKDPNSAAAKGSIRAFYD